MIKARFEIIMLAVAAAIVLAAAGGAAFRACAPKGGARGPTAVPLAQGGSGAKLTEMEPFDRFRVKLSGPDAPLLAARVVLLVPESDAELKEEMLGKRRAVAKAVEAFLAAKSEEDLAPAFEGTLKAELRDLVNSFLVLGKVEGVLLPLFTLIE